MEPTTTSSTLDNVNQEVLAKEVLMKLKPEFDALKDSELTTVNLDVPSAVATVLGALPEIREHRPEMQKALPDLNLDRIDNLENYAIALNEAHGSYLAAIEPGSELKAVIDEATALRETFMADAQALVRRGLVDAKQLAEIKGPVGFKNLATDLNLLANVLSASLAQIAGKSAITEAELDRATRLQQRLIRLIGLREQGTPTVAEAGVLRQKAFTSLTRAYDSARRAVTFLRWDSDDVDTIAPSLYAGRGGSKRKAAPGTDAAPGATGGGTNTGVTNTGGQAGNTANNGATTQPAGSNGNAANGGASGGNWTNTNGSTNNSGANGDPFLR